MPGLSLWKTPRYEPTPTPMGAPKTSPFGKKDKPITPAQAYSESIPQQTGDYEDIMSRYRSALDQPSGISSLMENYKNLLNQRSREGTDFSKISGDYRSLLEEDPYVAERLVYERGPEMTEAFGNLSELARTGGYSEADIANLRARGISPIRAVYANAMRNMERQKSLQGGYAPGAGAAAAKMAREQAGLIGGATTDVNARIAEAQAAGRREIAPQFAGFAAHETDLMNQIAEANRAAQEEAYKINLSRRLEGLGGLKDITGMEAAERGDIYREDMQRMFEALSGMSGLEQFGAGRESDLLRGMTSLYGTSPALVETFGNQVTNAAQLDAANKAGGLIPRRRTGGLAVGNRFIGRGL